MTTALERVLKRFGAYVPGRLLFLAVLLSSCGEPDGGASRDLLAKGDHFEVTVPELDQVLRAGPRVPAEDVAPARRVLLQRLVDEKLFAEAAIDAGLDRDVRTMQAIEAARRSILARAYAEKIAADTPRPSASEIAAARAQGMSGSVRALTIEELTAPAATAGLTRLQRIFDAGGLDALAPAFGRAGLPETRAVTRLAAADLAGVSPERLRALEPGAQVMFQTGDVAHFGRITAIERAPVSAESARDELADRMLAERRANMLDKEVARLRAERTVTIMDPSTKRPIQQPE